MTARPLLLLDVDGVLNPVTSSPPPGYRTVEVNGYRFHVSDLHRERLGRLVPSVDLVWASTWERAAKESIGPALHLPDSPVIRFAPDRVADTWKLPDVDRYVGTRPLIWIEDNLFGDAYEWAKNRSSPTLLIKPPATVGLTPDHFDQIDAFVAEL